MNALERDRGAIVARRVAALHSQALTIRSLLASPEAIGAVGETEVAAVLRGLSDEFWVLHDVRLEAAHFFRHEGKPVLSAQVDHIVVGPTGVFVIETKYWSRQRAARADQFSPYEQVGREGKLVWVLLKEAGWKVSVRNVIASRGALPAKAPGDFTKVLAPGDLTDYIRRQRTEVGREEAASIADFLHTASS